MSLRITRGFASIHVLGAVMVVAGVVALTGLTATDSHSAHANATHKPFAPARDFTATPTEEELFQKQVLPLALTPTAGANSAADNKALAAALTAFIQRKSSDDMSALTGFITNDPKSRWNLSLWANLGVLYYHAGYFSNALAAWKSGWELGQDEKGAKAKQIADYCVTQYLQMNARIGRKEELQPMLKSLSDRPMSGNPGVNRGYLQSDLWNMENHPENSFRCGPFALVSIFKSENKMKEAYSPLLLQSASSPNGFTLAQVQDLATKVGATFQIVQRTAGAPIIVPSVVHWKLNHYGAIVGLKDGKYLIKDPTFGTDFRVTEAAIDAESSGYFLVEGTTIPKGYQAVDTATANKIYGRGLVTTKDPKRCKKCEESTGCGCGGGMATYSLKLMLISLTLTDTPFWSTPPVGPSVSFQMTYNQQDAANQPPMFNQSNFGSCWTMDWMSYIIDDPTDLYNGVSLYAQGGGQEDYAAPDNNGNFPYQQESRATLARTISGSSVSYVRNMPDGSQQIYNQPNGVMAGPRFVYLTQIIDPQGRSLSINYDTQYRISTITDAVGKVTTLSYGLTSDPLKVTGISDTTGRSASFGYTNGQLSSITDMTGITSQFTYTSGTTDVASLQTPYGTTQFVTGTNANNDQRWIEVTNPIGQKERVEAIDTAPIPASDSVGAPSGMNCLNSYLNYRNTFYWDRKTYVTTGTSNYNTAKLYHFLHTENGQERSGILESVKKPFENRVWYNYQGQFSSIQEGTTGLRTATGRLLDDGTTAPVPQYTYNAQGAVTSMIDPLGRETDYQYAANGIDQTQVNQKTASGSDILSKTTYNTHHQPLTVADAAGQTTTYTYDPTTLDLLTVTTPPTAASSTGETTTYTYDPPHPHQPQTITVSGATTSYTYDSCNRVSTVTDSEGYTLTYSYDNLDRVTQVLYPDGTTDQKHYANLDQDTATDRLGRVTHFYYDGLRQRVATQDPLGRWTSYEWCYCGALQGLTDAMGRVTRWAYDIQGRMLSKTYPDQTQTTYTYENTTSRLHSVQDALGQLTTYAYNNDDTLASAIYTNTVHPTPNVSYLYETYYNRLHQMNDGVGTTTYAYGPVGQLGANQVLSTTGPLANDTIGYTYDSLGRPATTTVNGVPQSMSYDILDRVGQVVNPLGTFNYTYLRHTGRPTQVARVSGQTTNYNYYGGPSSTVDPRLSEISNLGNDGTTVLSDFTYQYNAVGDITNWVQTQGANPQQNANYAYDGSDRLTGVNLATPVTGVPTVTSYVYDNADNRLSEQRDNLVVQGSFNNLNQLTGLSGGGIIPIQGKVSKLANVAVNGKASSLNTNSSPYVFNYNLPVTPGTNSVSIVALDGSGNAKTNNYQIVVPSTTANSCTYDADGNCTSDGTRTYQWDAMNRLIQITDGGNTYQFAYDGQGRRVSETDNGTLVKQWVWVGNQMAEEQDGSNNVTKRFYAQGEQQTGIPYYYTRDHLGSVREMLNSSGSIVARYSYDPFGRTTLVSGTNLATMQFTGDYAHQPSALNLTKYRAYDPNSARWLSRDPLAESEGNDLYEYVTNDPIDNIDPTGLFELGGWTGPLHPDRGNGFEFQPDWSTPPTQHQAQKAADIVLNFLMPNLPGANGDPAGANNSAAHVVWTAPCGDRPILDMKVLTVPLAGSGNPQFSGAFATLEVKTRYAVSHTLTQALAATTAKFLCGCKQ